MESRTKEVTISDRDGVEHVYEIRPLPASKSLDLAVRVLAVISKPGIALIGQLAGEQGAENVDLTKIDLSTLGDNLDGALTNIAQDTSLIRRLFQGTLRDSKPVADDAGFNAAYTANYGEMYKALRHIIDANGFVPFISSLAS